MFVSIHVNAMPAGRRAGAASGVETYFLSDAKTEDQRRVADGFDRGQFRGWLLGLLRVRDRFRFGGGVLGSGLLRGCGFLGLLGRRGRGLRLLPSFGLGFGFFPNLVRDGFLGRSLGHEDGLSV